MSRLSALAFLGDDRWREVMEVRPAASHSESAAEAPHRTDSVPHEAPPVMALPLVVLAVLALVGGVLHLPGHPTWNPLAWLSPVFDGRLYQPNLSTGAQWALSIVDAVVAIGGIAVAVPLWSRQSEWPALEPSALRRALYIDDIYDALIGRPAQATARFTADVVETKVIDGAVMGLARLTRTVGSGLRRIQTGYVRQYALGIVLGLVALVAYMASRAWP
jgi:NADH-quinone oxidoreductase subunit L